MNKKITKLPTHHFITNIFTILTTIVYVTWFAATIEKRVSLIEQRSDEIEQQVQQNQTQDVTQSTRLEEDTNVRLANLDGKIDKIYGVLIDIQKNQQA